MTDVEELERLQLRAGDVLLVRLPRALSLKERAEVADNVSETLCGIGLKGKVAVFILDPGANIEILRPPPDAAVVSDPVNSSMV